WIGVVQAGSVLASEIVIIVLLVVLVRLIMLLPTSISTRPTDKLVTDGTFGLCLGWGFVATISNTAALLGTTGVPSVSGWQCTGAHHYLGAGVDCCGTHQRRICLPDSYLGRRTGRCRGVGGNHRDSPGC